jgi:hypothetical protein
MPIPWVQLLPPLLVAQLKLAINKSTKSLQLLINISFVVLVGLTGSNLFT